MGHVKIKILKMFKISYLIILVTLYLQGHKCGEMEEIFKELYIIPDLMDTAPVNQLNVSFTKGNQTIVISPGQLLPEEFQEVKPQIGWPPESDKHYYTLYMAGITKWWMLVERKGSNKSYTGTTNYPFGYEWHTWIVANIPGNDTTRGETIFNYIHPVCPAREYVTDRYVLLLFEQAHDKIKIDPPVDKNAGYRFNELSTLRDFIPKYNLSTPKFGNCFTFKWVFGTTKSRTDQLRFEAF